VVLDDGFSWQGTQHRSLSAIARKITGTAWSGPPLLRTEAKPIDKPPVIASFASGLRDDGGQRCRERSGRSDCHPLHVAAAAAITAPIVHIAVAIQRIGSVRRLSLALWPLDATDERQGDEHRDEPSMQIH
jgi:hypothetical protein